MESPITNYISELLYQHDCVIVPGFGGFVARHVPAGIFNSGGLITPPAKSVLFNKNLQNNDGLLANHIMEKQLLSYTAANAQIQAFVNECKNRLNSLKRIELENIGVLYTDHEKNIQFEPEANINYLISSFGLNAVFARPIISVEPITVAVPEFRDRIVAPEIAAPKKQKKYRAIAALVVGSVMVVSGLVVSTKSHSFNNTAWANLNPFSKTVSAKYSLKGRTAAKNNYVPEKPELLLADANGYAHINQGAEDSNFIYVKIDNNIPATADKTVETVNTLASAVTGSAFKIVLGCFSLEENAKKHLNNLRKKNISASLSGINKKGLHVVSGGTFKNLNEARAALLQMREVYPHAWLMLGEN